MNIPRILNNAGPGRHGLASGEKLHASFLSGNNVLPHTHAILHEICVLGYMWPNVHNTGLL